MNNEFDLFIIGGGINGAGIDRDAAGRNLKLTTYRKFAERAFLDLKNYLSETNNSWTDKQTINLTD